MSNIQKSHFAMIIKYTGISFITWGLSHWFFSWERQIITSLVWIIFFIAGTLLEQKIESKDYAKTILYSALLAVAIGAFTWWLQHFPDSPGRSLWIVPLGFIVSIYSYLALEWKMSSHKDYVLYIVGGFIASIALSLWFYAVVEAGYIAWEWHWHDGDSHEESVIFEQSVTWWTDESEVKEVLESHPHDADEWEHNH